MATRKKKSETNPEKVKAPKWPKVTEGQHSTRIEHEDGKIEMFTDYEKLLEDIRKAISDYENKKKG